MARIVGESDCTGIIKYSFSKYGIRQVRPDDTIKAFKDYYEDVADREQRQNFTIQEKIKDLMTKRYFGAIGEEKVINTLKLLPDTYYILNEVRIQLTKSVLWKKYCEHVKSAQIDHVVIGDTGIFLIETKNWIEMNLTTVHDSPHKQIDRAGMLFWLAQKKKLEKVYKTYNLVVTIKDLPRFKYKYVYQLSLIELNNFILSRSIKLLPYQIEYIKNWLVNLRLINPKFKSTKLY